ncbi:MAG: cation transporter [Chloroflexi bacterium]|nr:cation transporter [Chloroflexota bacterium]
MLDHAQHDHLERDHGLQPLVRALAVTLIFLVAELVGGLVAHSLALLADAAHMLTDAGSLGFALLALWLSGRPETGKHSFGYHRGEILAALANAALLWLASGFFFWEAARRIQHPAHIQAGLTLGVGLAGLGANLVSATFLLKASRGNLNIRAAFLHAAGDALASVGVVVSAVIIMAFGWLRADPIATIVIGVLILWSTARLVWRTVAVLMEGTPHDVDVASLERTMLEADGVLQVHDLHAWALTSGYNVMTAHAVVKDGFPAAAREDLLDRLRHLIPERFPIHHITIQLEESSRCCDVEHRPVGSHAH